MLTGNITKYNAGETMPTYRTIKNQLELKRKRNIHHLPKEFRVWILHYFEDVFQFAKMNGWPFEDILELARTTMKEELMTAFDAIVTRKKQYLTEWYHRANRHRG